MPQGAQRITAHKGHPSPHAHRTSQQQKKSARSQSNSRRKKHRGECGGSARKKAIRRQFRRQKKSDRKPRESTMAQRDAQDQKAPVQGQRSSEAHTRAHSNRLAAWHTQGEGSTGLVKRRVESLHLQAQDMDMVCGDGARACRASPRTVAQTRARRSAPGQHRTTSLSP